jgi:T5SS/PEP-CTERM-associated repeat protein
MMLLGQETITFTGTLDTASTAPCQGLMVCDNAVAIFAPGATLNDANALIVGNDAVGTLRAEGSGATRSVITSVVGQIGKLDDAIGIVTIDDAIWNNSGAAEIGRAGAGILNVVDNGAVHFGADVSMATEAGSLGTMTIAGGGSVAVALSLWLGGAPLAPGGTAVVLVGSGGSLTVGSALDVGSTSRIGIAGGTVTGGGVVDTIKTDLGGSISGYGTLAVSDGHAIVDDGVIRAAGGNLVVNASVGGIGMIEIAADAPAPAPDRTTGPAAAPLPHTASSPAKSTSSASTVPKNGTGFCCWRSSPRTNPAAVRISSAEARPTRAICTGVRSGALARNAIASANSRMISTCETIRACAAFAGISVANSCVSRATRTCRQPGGALAGGGGSAANVASSRSALR